MTKSSPSNNLKEQIAREIRIAQGTSYTPEESAEVIVNLTIDFILARPEMQLRDSTIIPDNFTEATDNLYFTKLEASNKAKADLRTMLEGMR